MIKSKLFTILLYYLNFFLSVKIKLICINSFENYMKYWILTGSNLFNISDFNYISYIEKFHIFIVILIFNL